MRAASIPFRSGYGVALLFLGGARVAAMFHGELNRAIGAGGGGRKGGARLGQCGDAEGNKGFLEHRVLLSNWLARGRFHPAGIDFLHHGIKPLSMALLQ